jgi:hypothetical protein
MPSSRDYENGVNYVMNILGLLTCWNSIILGIVN